MDICQIYDVSYYYCDYLYKTNLKEFVQAIYSSTDETKR
ncbi:hypothetical protein Gogos_012576 [Gossypium gossypioides]|uniref:Uncharacterized protein n=1 Tax=Gossypium gossypioides TaxID=34282 RepID=A0A7J9BSX0_GOSGO|nr:hypothetical protein [Gossypium gossypioides]